MSTSQLTSVLPRSSTRPTPIRSVARAGARYCIDIDVVTPRSESGTSAPVWPAVFVDMTDKSGRPESVSITYQVTEFPREQAQSRTTRGCDTRFCVCSASQNVDIAGPDWFHTRLSL
jgi:hypothetical protein